MTNKELYQATFSQVHGKVRQADFPRRKRRSPRTFGLLAAAVLLVAALSATAVAEDWFGLRQAALPQGDAGSGVEENVELLSLQGWFGSPEHQAAADWQDFLSHYDDGGALDAIGNGDTGLSERYLPYGVWTEEMAETLDAIAAKYNLALHQDNTIYDDTAAFLAVTGPFIDPALIYPGYAYPDGTFQCDGGWTAADGVERGFQFRRTAKGVFDEVYLNIGDADAYRQWVYETAEGVSLLLAERADGSRVIDTEALDVATRIQDRFFKQCRGCANDMGLTVTSRCRLVLPESARPPEENAFERLMREKRERMQRA